MDMIENYGYNLRFCEEKLIPLIRRIAARYMGVPFQIEKKGHGNFVTSVDREMENELKIQLHRLIPDAGFIAEESGKALKARLNWVIDPIDGTTNFIYGLPYAVSVALIVQEIRQVVIGVVYNPKTDKILNAAKRVYKFSSDLKRIGPSSLDICMVAEGKAKLYFELDLNIWDICAGILILTEAGGDFIQEDDLFLFGTRKVFALYKGEVKC